MKYEVNVKEISYGYITVEAVSKEEADRLAEKAYFDGKTDWASGEYELSEAKEVPQKAREDAR